MHEPLEDAVVERAGEGVACVLRLQQGAVASELDAEDGTSSDGSDEHDDPAASGRAVRVGRAQLVELESAKVEALRAAVQLACALVAADDVLVDAR